MRTQFDTRVLLGGGLPMCGVSHAARKKTSVASAEVRVVMV
jgi:hypothetical protein